MVSLAKHASSEDLLPIGSVVEDLRRVYPDISHSSLRFLEREGLITPVRTPGGHRLFTAADVARIRRIKEWQAQHLSLAEIRDRLADASTLGDLTSMSTAFLRDAVVGNLANAAQLVLRVDDSGVALKSVFGQVLLPALYEVGQQWASGALSVGQEKEISELTRDLVAELSRRHAAAEPTGPTVVAACVAGERHDLGLRMIVGLLRERGWRTHFLGADVAANFLAESVVLRHPDVVLLSATTAERLPALKEAVTTLRKIKLAHQVQVVVGGRGIGAYDAEIRTIGAIPSPLDSLDAVLDMVQSVAGEERTTATDGR